MIGSRTDNFPSISFRIIKSQRIYHAKWNDDGQWEKMPIFMSFLECFKTTVSLCGQFNFRQRPVLQVVLFQKHYFLRQLTQNRTLWFDRNSTFFCISPLFRSVNQKKHPLRLHSAKQSRISVKSWCCLLG